VTRSTISQGISAALVVRASVASRWYDSHTVCVVMTSTFLDFSKSQGNYRSTERGAE
jgi:uncharacterized protein (DUF2237 family)